MGAGHGARWPMWLLRWRLWTWRCATARVSQSARWRRQENSEDAIMVYCVMCIDGTNLTVHIFSTQEKAQAFADADSRDHVLYDYVIDQPERMEQQAQ